MKRIGFLCALILLVVGCTGARAPEPGAGLPPAPHAPAGQVAYIQDGDLRVKPLGGQALRLTDAGGFSSPAFSPSGDWILARKGAELWTVRADGSARVRLPITGSSVFVAWSPTADRIAYRTDDRIGVLLPDGAGDTRLVQLARDEHVSRIAWSPDGAFIGYDTRVFGPGTKPSPASIRRVPAAGGEPQDLYTTPPSDLPECLIMAGWSADGASALFWPTASCSASLLADGTSLMSVPAAGGAPQELVKWMLVHPEYLAVSPTGAIAVTQGAGRTSWTDKQIAVVPAGDGAPRVISPAKMAATNAVWSPDGKRLAFVAMPDAGPELGGGEKTKAALAARHIWLANADGAELRQVTTNAAYRDEAPVFTADGEHLLFVRMTPDGAASLWLTPVAGGTPEQVAEIDPPEGWMGFYGRIEWSAKFTFRPR